VDFLEKKKQAMQNFRVGNINLGKFWVSGAGRDLSRRGQGLTPVARRTRRHAVGGKWSCSRISGQETPGKCSRRNAHEALRRRAKLACRAGRGILF
jgi:hypothetical protein